MIVNRHRMFWPSLVAGVLGLALLTAVGQQPGPTVALPQGRTAYFVGEQVLVQVTAAAELTVRDGGTVLWQAPPGTFVLDTSRLAPGAYRLGDQAFFIVPVERRSAASFQDETFPGYSGLSKAEQSDPVLRAQAMVERRETVVKQLTDTGLTAGLAMMACAPRLTPSLDAGARTQTMMFVNPETRPTSFYPVHVDPVERDGLTQRMLFTAQCNERYPNFGGFCVGFDCSGFQPGNRRMLLRYWQWGNQTASVAAYLERNDRLLTEEFKRRSGFAWVTPAEYIRYTLAIKRPDMAPAIDLPTQRYLDDLAQYLPPMGAAELATLEKRLDAWSTYLMGLYPETYTYYMQGLRGYSTSLRHTASVQIDHAPVMQGQYLPTAYEPLDFRYQSTWNDQVGAPDYAYQWLFTAAMLNMQNHGRQPVWVSNAYGPAHGKSPFPGKLPRVAAHILAQGGSGLGFAFEAFSTIMGGMGGQVKTPAAWADVSAGREFINRFAALAVNGQGDYGVGVLFSKTQFCRQYVCQAFGTPQFRTLISLTRLGYTPVFLTEQDVAEKKFRGVQALAVVAQTVPLPAEVMAGLAAFTAAGGELFRDGSTIIELPGAQTMAITLPLRSDPGKPHNWAAPNGDPTFLFAREHQELAPALDRVLAGRGHCVLRAERGSATELTLEQINGGAEATYITAVNDTFVKSQADWRVLREKVLPRDAEVSGFLYDLTDEQALGKLAPFTAEFSDTTARVYALLKRELPPADLRARQDLVAGDPLRVQVRFGDLAAVLPFSLTISRPDGTAFFAGYRATDASGRFAYEFRLPGNAPLGAWQVAVRSQLNGVVTTLPVQVKAGPPVAVAVAYDAPVIVRRKDLIEQALVPGTTWVLPLFPAQADLRPVAESLRTTLAAKGVTVKIEPVAELPNYYLAYELTTESAAANARVEESGLPARIQRGTRFGNDWFGGQTGYYCAQPLMLLDVAGRKDNELAEAIDQAGMLWPDAAHTGRPVVQGLAWAFAPRQPAIVLQAVDAAGLQAAAGQLLTLPDDFLTGSVDRARAQLFREQHIGGAPAQFAGDEGLTAQGLKTQAQPQRFRLDLTDTPPYPENTPTAEKEFVPKTQTIPVVVVPADVVGRLLSARGYVPALGYGVGDMRFADAEELVVSVPQAGPVELGVMGVFRYYERAPCDAPQWADLLALRSASIPKAHRPPRFDVLVDGKLVGTLDQVLSETRAVQVELYAPQGGQPKTEQEEVAVDVSGRVPLPAGEHRLLLVQHDIIDGQFHYVRLGVAKAAADEQIAAWRAAAEAEKQRQEAEKKRKAAEKKR